MREPYRVAVWGPGTMGQAAIREIIRLPETELVAVHGYNPENKGRDVGDLLGISSTGVAITTDFDDIVAAKPEVLIHTPRDFGDFRADDDIIRLLEAGINVVSVLPYHIPLRAARTSMPVCRLLAKKAVRRCTAPGSIRASCMSA